MDERERKHYIAMYRDGYNQVVQALAGASDADLDKREAPGEWSPREIVHHLADSEMTSAIRFRRVLVEDAPLIQGYDQEAFARLLFYDRPIAASLEAFRFARESTAAMFEYMHDEQWKRGGTHTESGPYLLEDWLRIYGVHAHEHADQIRRARAAS
ncbi:MAG: hypothetical protein DCC58_01260 [Chloroflexi bacterium]|nr:MAG: hypothetical protein DCC58_01260 [Chloroflexota bacterium]